MLLWNQLNWRNCCGVDDGENGRPGVGNGVSQHLKQAVLKESESWASEELSISLSLFSSLFSRCLWSQGN